MSKQPFTVDQLSPEARIQYFVTGYPSLDTYMRSLDWSKIKLFESKPDEAFIDFTLLPKKWPDFLAAKHDLLRYACNFVTSSCDYIEFGVREGVSMAKVTESLKDSASRFYGLDTFTGLPEGWVAAWGNRGDKSRTVIREQGAMSVAAPPVFQDPRVILKQGLFQTTLPTIIPDIGNRQLFINVDGDTYTGALYALASLQPKLKPGDLVYFDEFLDELGEYAAWNDFIRSYYMKDKFKLLARAYDGFLFVIV